MDLQFLKFWGEAIRQSEAGKTLMDEIGRWMKGDIKESDEMYALFRKYYGMEQGSSEFKDYENQLKEVLKNFQNSFKELLSMLGVVPKAEYDHLHQQYEDLEKKVADMEETLRDLGKQLGKNPSDYQEGAGAFDEMVKAQTEQFQKLMNTFTEISGLKASKDKKK